MNTDIVQASIITIGDELMIGQVIDTNSAWIAAQLNLAGIWVRKRVAVGDNYHEMWRALEEEGRESRIVLITGGLGPTADDITKPFLCDFFNTTLVMNQQVLEHVTHLFENVYKRPLIERNRKQAEVPAACTIIHNARGTAPGMLFEKDGVIYISMPGVPHEMKGMMTDLVLPLIKEKTSTGHILHRTLLTAGIGESALAEHIKDWEAMLSERLKLAYLPNYGMVRLRITATGIQRETLQKELDAEFQKLKGLVNVWLVTDEDLTMPQVVRRLLKEKHKTIATAESCTGGYVAHLLTREAGASAVFKGSIVSYANQVKQDLLMVNSSTLGDHGAVSREAVTEMAGGALKALQTDYAIAISGIMGPDGGSDSKPVGTVWIAVGEKTGQITTQHFHFRFDRERNIELTANNALNMMRKFILSHQ